jgi:DNA repair protein RadC
MMVKDRNFIKLPVGVGKNEGKMSNYEESASALHYLTDDSPTELMVMFFLNGQNGITGAEIIAKGGRHGCAVTAADILRSALISNASGIIIGHNHPSGDPVPSAEDIEMTIRLMKACDTIGLTLLDHIVVARDGKDKSVMGYI